MPFPPPKRRPRNYPARRVLVFSTPYEKAKWLDAACSLDAIQPRVRSLAARFAMARGPNDIEGQARDFHRFVRDAVTYVRDPSREEFCDSTGILNRGYGDCDDKARLFVALCRAVSIECRIRPVFNRRGQFTHVQAECKWPGSELHPLTQVGGWILSDTIVKGLPLGGNPQTAPRDELGNRILS